MLSGLPSVRPFVVRPSVCPVVRPLTWIVMKLGKVIVTRVAITEKVFKVRAQRSRSQQNQMLFRGEGLHSTVWGLIEAHLFYQ